MPVGRRKAHRNDAEPPPCQETKAVAWNLSLDGNLFRSSHHVSRCPWVAQAAVGIGRQRLVAGRGIRLALMRVRRTRKFDEQMGRHAFGSIALSLES